ncbi:MAG: hypothetical protein H7A53_09260 [Akkermansiaceae bacterium]|nr:hypothetical protein [Akkermansiaceae bacterium]
MSGGTVVIEAESAGETPAAAAAAAAGAERDTLVATVLGWQCCGDFPLRAEDSDSDSDTASPTMKPKSKPPRAWRGGGNARPKDARGPDFAFRLTREGGTPTLAMTITRPDRRQWERKVVEQALRPPPPPSAALRPPPQDDESGTIDPRRRIRGDGRVGDPLTRTTGREATTRFPAPPNPRPLFPLPGLRPLAFTFDVGDFFGPPDPATEGAIPRSRLVVLVSGHAGLKARFRNSPFGLSYLPVVWDRWFAGGIDSARPPRPAPRRILEWGPGRSTLFFAELFPEARIDGVEHDPRWFAHCRALEAAFSEPGGRVRMHLRRLAIAPGRAEGYVTWPLVQPSHDRASSGTGRDASPRRPRGAVAGDVPGTPADGWVSRPDSDPFPKYDLIFIDGRLRVDCAAVARLVLAEGGTILLHDAHRENYRVIPCFFRQAEVVFNSGIFEV